jgi:hypothetical protein
MAREDLRKTESADTADTARIDRRGTVLAQIEAALLANKLSVIDFAEERNGTDPYNHSRSPVATVWDQKRVR